MSERCERCGTSSIGYELLDYCASCGRDLCPACMEKGCCGHVPALSGTDMDNAIEEMNAPPPTGSETERE